MKLFNGLISVHEQKFHADHWKVGSIINKLGTDDCILGAGKYSIGDTGWFIRKTPVSIFAAHATVHSITKKFPKEHTASFKSYKIGMPYSIFIARNMFDANDFKITMHYFNHVFQTVCLSYEGDKLDFCYLYINHKRYDNWMPVVLDTHKNDYVDVFSESFYNDEVIRMTVSAAAMSGDRKRIAELIGGTLG